MKNGDMDFILRYILNLGMEFYPELSKFLKVCLDDTVATKPDAEDTETLVENL